ncbi:IclR family transcriptional regulator C-terminal domain-containing protein [Streptomyces sp. NBC_00154]|uniref:IclR family transcriptional regulator domain-containing protein n=1 Tax=Streptomyces sp. NBC_00154 TaxID=2975670 RepID=UPI002B1D5714|nr:IclR family transcriptional regulator C-terminal domain-containing protein [Streptomyces sp. NBC_00154]
MGISPGELAGLHHRFEVAPGAQAPVDWGDWGDWGNEGGCGESLLKPAHAGRLRRARRARCTVLVGVRVGDALVFADHAGQESPNLTFVARTHARRPLFTTAAGKTLLASVPDEEMYRLLELAGAEQAGEVRQFLVELPEIRSRRLAFNRGVTFKDAFAVATPLLASDGSPIAAISAAVDPSEADRLDDVGEELKKAVAVVGPRYGLNHA